MPIYILLRNNYTDLMESAFEGIDWVVELDTENFENIVYVRIYPIDISMRYWGIIYFLIN